MEKTRRIESIDFWRGVALLLVFIDHVPGNPIGPITPRNFGFSDSAEAFVFLSGLVFAHIYWSKFIAGETGSVVARCLRRSTQIYGAHIASCVSVLALFGVGYLLTRDTNLLNDDNRSLFFSHPLESSIGLLTLGYQFGYVNILPVYVTILLMTPALLALLRRSIWIGLSFSAALWAAAQFGLQMPSWPWPQAWFLDPFAWQFIFTLGMASAILARSKGIPHSRYLVALAAAIVFFAFFVEMDGFGFVPGLSAGVDSHFAANKELLGLGRISHFLALAYLMVEFKVGTWLLKIPGASDVSRLGRYSLTIFAVGTFISAVCQLVLDLCQPIGNNLAFDTIALFIVVLGIMCLIFLAHLLEWQKLKSVKQSGALPKADVVLRRLAVSSRSS